MVGRFRIDCRTENRIIDVLNVHSDTSFPPADVQITLRLSPDSKLVVVDGSLKLLNYYAGEQRQ